MKKIHFPRDPEGALRGNDVLLVIGTQPTLTGLRGAGDDKLRAIVHDLANEAKPGDTGATATTLPAMTSPRRLWVGTLPSKVSRYNSEARPEAVQRVTAAVRWTDKKGAILAVLERAELLIPTLNAIVRALPLFSAKTGNSKSGPKSKQATIAIAFVDRNGKSIPVPPAARIEAETVREAARLVDAPPTDMNPERLAKEVRRLLRGIRGVKVQEIIGDKLLERRLGALHAVGRTAMKAPRLLIASYTPAKARQHIALVGKGITYDTGGLHLKARGAMETMKGDMGGAAAVFGAFRILAATGCKHRLSLVLCLAENAIGPNAFKPDDVLVQHSGKTVEINNTDAEGRLVLGDGVSYAARVLKADTILDAATLTGAQMVSTGINHAAIFSNDADLERLVIAAGYASGDLVHPLPFAPEFYKREFNSPIADMRNSVRNRSNAQSSCAAQFIYWHIEDTSARWCHVDLAGPAFINDRGTGFGAALLAETVRRL